MNAQLRCPDFQGGRGTASRLLANPMEGFDSDKIDEILGLRKLNLKSSTLAALGYRNENKDWLVKLKKVRKPESEIFIKI